MNATLASLTAPVVSALMPLVQALWGGLLNAPQGLGIPVSSWVVPGPSCRAKPTSGRAGAEGPRDVSLGEGSWARCGTPEPESQWSLEGNALAHWLSLPVIVQAPGIVKCSLL